jgi:hypothetical protein
MSDHCFILSTGFVVSIWISVSSIYYSIVYIQQALITNYLIIYLLFYCRYSAGADNFLHWDLWHSKLYYCHTKLLLFLSK